MIKVGVVLRRTGQGWIFGFFWDFVMFYLALGGPEDLVAWVWHCTSLEGWPVVKLSWVGFGWGCGFSYFKQLQVITWGFGFWLIL